MALIDDIHRRLDEIPFPGFPHSVARYGLVDAVAEQRGEVTISLVPASRRRELAQTIARRIEESVSAVPGVRSVRIVTAGGTEHHAHAHAHGHEHPQPQSQNGIPGVRAIVAVSSAKGGVGKSTVAVNLALALARTGAKVALMDADVYGPSAPLMLGIDRRPQTHGQKIAPIERHGIAVMSMGFFLDDSSPVIWRGPMVMGLIRQFLRDVDWGPQDFLIVDMPPGTGDAALTLAQQVPLSGAVIVTTPQDVALADVERGIGMFRQLNVPVLGIVENMSVYVCPDCGEAEEIFGRGGGDELAERFGVAVLARLPLVAEVREGGDVGRPITIAAPDHAVSKAFADLARSIDQELVTRALQDPGRPL